MWRASTALGGNPGTTDAIPFAGTPLADADLDRLPAFFEYALGTSDTTPDNRPPGTLNRDASGRLNFTFPRGLGADDVELVIEGAATLAGPWSPATAVRVSSTIIGTTANETWQITPPVGSASFFIRLRATLR